MTSRPFADVSDATRKAMRANKGKDTKPEMAVRRLVHGMGQTDRNEHTVPTLTGHDA